MNENINMAWINMNDKYDYDLNEPITWINGHDLDESRPKDQNGQWLGSNQRFNGPNTNGDENGMKWIWMTLTRWNEEWTIYLKWPDEIGLS